MQLYNITIMYQSSRKIGSQKDRIIFSQEKKGYFLNYIICFLSHSLDCLIKHSSLKFTSKLLYFWAETHLEDLLTILTHIWTVLLTNQLVNMLSVNGGFGRNHNVWMKSHKTEISFEHDPRRREGGQWKPIRNRQNFSE